MGLLFLPPNYAVRKRLKEYTLVVSPQTGFCQGSADCWVERMADPRELWADIHDGAGTHLDWTGPGNNIRIISSSQTNKYYVIDRSILTFDTICIPARAEILSVVGSFKVMSFGNTLSALASIGWYGSTPGNVCTFNISDYQQLGSTLLSATKLINDLVRYEWCHLTFTAAGRAAITKEGITCLGLREATYDGPDIAPPWVSAKDAKVMTYSSENVDNAPYITIVYLA